MLPHPDSVVAFGLIRHQELQAENLRVRRAMTAVPSRPVQPGVLSRTRGWVGSVLIRMGTSLQVETREPSAPLGMFHSGVS
jgi:hypothetical protein